MAPPEKPRPTPKRLLVWNIVQTALCVSMLLILYIAPKFWASLPFQSDPTTHDNYTAICCFMILSWLVFVIAPYCLVRSIQLARMNVVSTGLMASLILINGVQTAIVLWRALDEVVRFFSDGGA
ncbi:MAG TPA: hypothetical protein DCX60_00755 [Phycisphaerales bacterium]|nr:hypothetical protein [Phycisphaerales bacterium]